MCSMYGNCGRMQVIVNGAPLEEMNCFQYLGSQVAADAWSERDVVHRMNEGYRVWGVLKSMLSNRGLERKAKKCLYEGVIVLTALYGAEAWEVLREGKWMFLRWCVWEVWLECHEWVQLGMKSYVRELACGKNVWVLYGQKGVDSRSGGRVRGRPRLAWMDGVNVALGNRGTTVETARKIGKNEEPWYIYNWLCFMWSFLLGPACVLSDRAPVVTTWGGMRLW